MTAEFLRHVGELIPPEYILKPVILDDNSTDQTVSLALEVCPGALLLHTGGSSYWGGALNYIHYFISSLKIEERSSSLYMVCNDDIRFLAKSLLEPLSAVKEKQIVAIRTVFVNKCILSDFSEFYANPFAFEPEPFLCFDPLHGCFTHTSDASKANVCDTRALLTTAEPWLSVSSIPSSIPHYLSDYWLTYSFSSMGYKINFLSSFVCVNSLLTTNNAPSSPSGFGHVRVPGLISFIVDYTLKLYVASSAAVSKTSPSYAPAWICFLTRFSRQKNLDFVIAKYCLLYLLGRALAVFRYPGFV